MTVVIAAFNEEACIGRAIESVLRQTLQDIEVLIADDGSTDGTRDVVETFRDARIRYVNFGHHGYAGTLRRACEVVRGRNIAIMDADDESYPERLKKQVALLDANPAVMWVGAGEERIDTRRNEHSDRLYPAGDAEIRRMASRCIPYCHSSVMFRRRLVASGLTYDPDRPFLIDFDLFLRVAEKHQVANVPEILVRRRLRGDSFFQRSFSGGRQNRVLARMCLSAVRRFRLPPYYAIFPLARLGYLWLPDPLKRGVRRLFGPVETARQETGAHGE